MKFTASELLRLACVIAENSLESDESGQELRDAIIAYRIRRWGMTDAERAWRSARTVSAESVAAGFPVDPDFPAPENRQSPETKPDAESN